ncbi:CoB--CoM heterodisulfide reductase iron-sulfur subunit A family protein [Dissulfurirhabdus thermomarina]|uniref:CoB--CoM heterodisulfide reductase iron-sulfur subunit A family protein n=1 Tax=Dissulfurirhabdus thermomarina TaxID=1765737 RepID=A0A6N9TKM2_DISTH|nr:CoB--CoM heterodisulfide reductase iron-sulfur subunit A family protein [Dissulfurirhabdus thermomarina]NDY41821.1 CoB--CoM heterodisulfide reductase iron-sulfur subunit A family protein [Dissulfurirhabdus thermomarina]NMX22464.1 CoB--CoM heterodisulfide reductase iron-sulfur subunit A family protein [Dissulfurirhabdus thermomarina]
MSAPAGGVLVVGGGIAGVQAALDLADAGFRVHLVERTAAIGGRMSQLDKTFPTNDCSACILSPKLVECGRHRNIDLYTLTEVLALEGEPGAFRARLRRHPRYIDPDRCIACGRCADKCPKQVPDEFDLGLGRRKAAYLKYPQAVPLKYAIDPDHCIRLKKPGRCGFCIEACPADAVNFDDRAEELDLDVGAVILAPGFAPFHPGALDFTGYGRLPNVVTAMEFERLLSPSGPCMGHPARPGDGAAPRRIAWLQCVGSRDIHRCNRPYCSAVCCMYAVKQAVIAREHLGADLEAHVFYMDLRTPGKGFEAYAQRAAAEGVRFHRARVHSVLPAATPGGLSLRFMDDDGEIRQETFDLVVLSVGLEMDPAATELARRLGVELDPDGFIRTDPFAPVQTSRPGVFACGAATEPKDIPQTVVEAGAAAHEAARLLAPVRWQASREETYPEERDVSAEPPRIGVFVCHCGVNIGAVVDVPAVRDYARTLPDVVFAQDNLFTCSQDTIDQIAETVRRERLNRVVVASCSPRTHEPLFQATLRAAGLNPHLFEMANIRDQDAWVHPDRPDLATEKAKDLVRMAVARVREHRPLPERRVPVTRRALVVGGGVAGMSAALALADQGFPVTLVEREAALGGQARALSRTWEGHPVAPWLEEISARVASHPLVDLRTGVTVAGVEGSVGRFRTRLSDGTEVAHGAAVIAVGGEPWRPEDPWRFGHGDHPGVMTLLELDRRLAEDAAGPAGLSQAVFIHCVGSRVPERPYCSRVCCTHAIEQALELKTRHPDADIFMLYRDIRTYGRREHLYQEARARGIVFVRYDLDRPPEVTAAGGRLEVTVREPILGRDLRLHPDLVVLATAIRPRADAGALSRFFKCAVGADGFLLEAHMKLRPVDFATEGVFLAGLCHYPKPIEESVAQAQAAAARAARVLAREAVAAEPITAVVDPARCTACGVCEAVCPYHAVTVDPAAGAAVVDPGLCKGCGACTAGCRSGAVTLPNLDNAEILAAVEACLEESPWRQ